MAIQTAQQPAPDKKPLAQAVEQAAETAASESSVAQAPPADLTIAEMTRIMDVASVLRNERSVAEQQLNLEDTKAMLRRKLIETAQITGDSVSEAEIDAAIEHYFDNLHEFDPPKASFETFLAHLYVARGTITRWAMVIGAAGAAWWAFAMM